MTPVTSRGISRFGCGLVAAAIGLLGIAPCPASAGSVQRQTSSYGHTHEGDGRLRQGCHRYRYHYVVKTPSGDWALETFLHDPTGDTLASGTYLSDSDPRDGTGIFRFCGYSTRPGTFTIRSKVHWYGAYGQEHVAHFEPSRFRLRLEH